MMKLIVVVDETHTEIFEGTIHAYQPDTVVLNVRDDSHERIVGTFREWKYWREIT